MRTLLDETCIKPHCPDDVLFVLSTGCTCVDLYSDSIHAEYAICYRPSIWPSWGWISQNQL